MAGVLYVVATPIGNLEDITLRALRVLKEVDLIAAEDTRHTKKLLAHYGITTPLTSYYDQIEARKAPALLAELRAGKAIALVSDAGTPGIADPGYRLVTGAVAAGVPVVPIPGPSAPLALLSIGGLPTDRFVFEGFLPAKKGQRQKALQRLRYEERTLVFFEAPHRLAETLADLERMCGDRQVVVGRELTKMFEEVVRGTVSEVRARLQDREVKGEVVLLVAGRGAGEGDVEELPLADEIRQLTAEGLSLKEIAQIVGERRGMSKRDVYAAGVGMRHGRTQESQRAAERRTGVMNEKTTSPIERLMGLLFKAHPWHGVAIGPDAPATVTCYIEIVPSDTVKYEIDKTTGFLKVDRPQKFSNVCPSLYGFVPRTFCDERVGALCAERTGRAGIVGDGDPLDICVLTEKTIPRGDILLQAIPIGGLRMIDNNEADDKIIAVMQNDAVYGNWREITDCPAPLIERLKHYFLTYKEPPNTSEHHYEITHVYGRQEAYEVIRRSQEDYRARFGDPESLLAAVLPGVGKAL